MNSHKKIPYAIPNFESIITENYCYVDKTHFIEMLEKEVTKYQFLIRPRKFGKSLFTSVLEHYYDLRFAGDFKKLFGDLYIGKNPTPKKNSYFVINFDFSGIDTSDIESFKSSFTGAIRGSIAFFLSQHRSIFKDYEELDEKLMNFNGVRDYIEFAFKIINSYGKKAYIIIDEYDHFANDVIAKGTKISINQYRESVWANSITRDFYETLKSGTKTVVDKIFLTGITPVMLDDITSGFNIADNLSLDVRYNEILGFTENDVNFLIDNCGIDRTKINVDIKFLYNGYLFHENAENKLYNSAMMLYFLNKNSITNGELEDLIDDNLKIDYGRIRMMLNKPGSIDKLTQIIEFDQISTKVAKRFSIDKIHESKNFFSLIYYMGLLTIDKDKKTGTSILKVPNYSIKTMYWEYMENIIMERNPKMGFDSSMIYESMLTMAFDDAYKPFFDHFQKNFVSQLSNRDLEHFSEKNIKLFLLSILFQNNFHLPISETENSKGYTDIYLQRRNDIYPRIKTDWVWELKYVKQADADNEKIIEAKKSEAIDQLKHYKTSNLFKNRTDVRYLAIVFTGKKDYWIKELE